MDGIHDMGGMVGFGPVPQDEEVFHADWEPRAFAICAMAGVANTDAFRHAIERLDPVTYLTVGYFGRWLAATELLVREADPAILPKEPGSLRPVEHSPRFSVGDRVIARNVPSSGHTRLPRYARGRTGSIAVVHPSFVLPDTNAHGRGENPQHVYAVRFEGSELFGEAGEASTSIHVDLFESYLEPADA